jgi:epoxyqueuosine reductase
MRDRLDALEGTLAVEMEAAGFEWRIAPIERLESLQKAYAVWLHGNLLNGPFVRERLASFTFAPPDCLRSARSLIVVSMPQPVREIRFRFQGTPRPVLIPPTYDTSTDRIVRDLLDRILEPAGFKAVPFRVPEKLLAVSTGLMEYGRNNIGYIPGKGSFHRLAVFATDLGPARDGWREPVRMERCGPCRACLQACPTGAIDPDRFIIRAEHCLTFHNERNVPIPDSVHPSWHHCLFGCLRCQTSCPENSRGGMSRELGSTFSEGETERLLRMDPHDSLHEEFRRRIERLCPEEEYRLLCRNLRLLIN